MGDRKVDLVIDCVGSVDIIKEGARFLVPGGRGSVYGVMNKATANINLVDLPNNVCIQMLNWALSRASRT
jgi:threonine dehydrogenase-like Zn-dependent dehydrogenase